MITVRHEQGMRFVIYANDHAPAHVHAIVGSGEAKVTTLGPEGPSFKPLQV